MRPPFARSMERKTHSRVVAGLSLTALSLGLGSALLLDSKPAHTAVFGADNRAPLPATHRQLEASIGVLYESRSRTICTAFCVADDVIATASHCLFRTSGEDPPRLSGFSFRPANKPPRAAVRIAGATNGAGGDHIIAGSTRLSIRPPIEATRDWAVARLAAPLCKGRALAIAPKSQIEMKSLADSGRIYQVGYHHDLPSLKLALGRPCWMRRGETQAERSMINRDFADTRDLVLHACDTGGASSGSPLLVDTPSGPEVVAINVGTYVRSKVLMQNGDVVHRYKSDTIANTAVGAGAFVHAIEALASVEIVTGRAEMQSFQSLLSEQGYYRGPRDGLFGPAMRAAIENFERAQQRPITGLASTHNLEELIVASGGRERTVERSEIETGSISTPRRPRRKGQDR